MVLAKTVINVVIIIILCKKEKKLIMFPTEKSKIASFANSVRRERNRYGQLKLIINFGFVSV